MEKTALIEYNKSKHVIIDAKVQILFNIVDLNNSKLVCCFL